MSYDELVALAGATRATRDLVVCSLCPDAASALRVQLGDAHADAFHRELVIFLRRNLRGSDVVATRDDELVLLMESTLAGAVVIADRLLSATRTHHFSAGGADRSVRATLALGLAAVPRSGESSDNSLFDVALESARAARRQTGGDSARAASAPHAGTLDVSRFIGRAEQVAQLTDFLDDMVRGVGRVVAVVGESGVGASSLIRTLEPEVRLRGGSMVVGACRDHHLPSPYALWSEVLHAIRRLPVKSTRIWRELSSLDPSLEHGPEQATHGGSKTHLFEELADFLRLAAQQRPLVLLLENVQWADAASWDALESLITQLESERILLALTFQTGHEADDRLEQWSRLGSRPRHHEIRLTHLTRDDVKRWLESTLRTSDLSRELVAYVYRHSEGSPLVLTQLVRDLVEGGQLTWTDDAWQWGAATELPPAVSGPALITRRLARLRPTARAVLEVASVLGREFDEMLLRALALGDDESQSATRQLVEAGLLVPTYDRDRAAFVVAHDEIARAVRAPLTAARSAALHEQVARLLATTERARPAEIAGHYEMAGNQLEAHAFANRAVDHALSVHESGAAAELLAAAERTAPSPAALAEVRVRMATLAEVAGRYEEAEARCDEALAWFEGQGERMQALQLKRTRALVRMKRGEGARETLAELLSLEAEASAMSADMERAALLLLIAQLHWRLGDLRAAQRVAEEALEIAERGDDALLLADASNRLAVTIQLENAPRARELFTRALDVATALGDAFRRVRGLNNIGVLEMINNNLNEARQVLIVAVEQARTAGIIESWGRAELNLGVLAGRLGDYDGALRAFSEALRLMSVVQNSEEQLYATYNLADLERDHGHLREASDTYDLVVGLAERIGQVPIQAGAHAGLGLCQFQLGDFVGAGQSLARAEALTERLVEWFQGRELIEALNLHLLIRRNEMHAAVERLALSLPLADASDVLGSAWLIAEFGIALRPHARTLIDDAVARYENHPDVLANPKIRDRFAVLKSDS